METKNEISHKVRKFLGLNFSEFLWHFFSKSRDILSFPEHFCEIPAKIHQNFAEKCSKIANFNGKHRKRGENDFFFAFFDEFCDFSAKFQMLMKSCRNFTEMFRK